MHAMELVQHAVDDSINTWQACFTSCGYMVNH